MNAAHLAAAGLPPVSPLQAFFFDDTERERWLIPPEIVERHKDEAVGRLEEALSDKGMAVFWQDATPELFSAQGGEMPSWVEARMETIIKSVPDGSVLMKVEYVLKDPFLVAVDGITGARNHCALWDGYGEDGAPGGEIAYDWDSILPARMAAN